MYSRATLSLNKWFHNHQNGCAQLSSDHHLYFEKCKLCFDCVLTTRVICTKEQTPSLWLVGCKPRNSRKAASVLHQGSSSNLFHSRLEPKQCVQRGWLYVLLQSPTSRQEGGRPGSLEASAVVNLNSGCSFQQKGHSDVFFLPFFLSQHLYKDNFS